MWKKIMALLQGDIRPNQAINLLKHRLFKPNSCVSYAPPRLGIFVTGRCNMKCTMCLTHSPIIPDNPFKYQGAKDMAFEMFKDILAHFPRTRMASFIGNGEPLLNNDLFLMIALCQKEKIKVSLFTNGLILDRYINSIIDHHVSSINISLNAINPHEYHRFTGNNETIYKQCLANTRALINEKHTKKSPLQISLSLIVDRLNYKTMPEMIAFAENLGIDSLMLTHFMPSESAGQTARERCLYAHDKEITNYIKSLCQKKYSIDILFPTLLDGLENNRLCRDALFSMSIDGDGNISGCERQLLNTAGHGKYWDKNVFNNEHMQNLRRTFLEQSGKLPTPCKTCYNNSTCPTSFLKASGQARKTK